MTYEEVKEISRRLKQLGDISLDVRLDNTKLGGQPEFFYYDVQIDVGEENNGVTVVQLIINEDPTESEIRFHKCDYKFINDQCKQEQQKAYDTCKQIVRDYLNGNLLKSEAKEWNYK